MEGKIDMAARRQVTNKLRTQYRKATKADRGKILDRVVATTGVGRSTARRMLTGPRLPDPAAQVDGRTLRSRGFSDAARALLEITEDDQLRPRLAEPFATIIREVHGHGDDEGEGAEHEHDSSSHVALP